MELSHSLIAVSNSLVSHSSDDDDDDDDGGGGDGGVRERERGEDVNQ